MNFSQMKEILFREAKKAGLTDYDVYYRMGESISADAIGKKPNSFASGTSGGISFRCAVNGCIGAASTQSRVEEDLGALVARAIANAAVVDPDEEPIFFEGSERYSATTVQVPQAPSLHPSFTEYRCRSSLRYRSSGLSSSVSRSIPLTVN